MIRVLRIPFSTNVERVALALGHKGLEAEWVDVDPGDRSPVRALSGQDLVPVAELDGEVVVDSMRIVRRLDELRPDPPLFPRDPAPRAELDVFLDWFDRVWKVPPNEIEAELGAERPDERRIERLGAEMAARLDLFDDMLAGREHLMGDELTAADVAAYPFLKYALGRGQGDDELFHEILDRHQPLGDRHARLAAWIRRMQDHRRA